MFQEIDYLFHSSKNLLIFQEIHYLFHSRKTCWRFERYIIYSIPEKPADVSRDTLFISFPKNQQMFQEIDYLFHFSEKPTDVSRDRLFISFSEKPADVSREISCFVSEQKLKFRNPVRRSIPDSVSDSGSANVR